MADEAAARTPGASGAAEEQGGTRKKIAGKYDNLEAAVEALDKGQTAAYHETREEMSAIRSLLERALTPVGTRGTDDQGYERGRVTDDDAEFEPTNFLASPGKVIKAREAKLEARLRKEYDIRSANQIAAATTVLRFQAKNPDLDEHEGLVTTFMRETNPNDSLAKRLNDAAKATRAYLKRIKAEGKDAADESLSEGEIVEEPTQQRRVITKPKDEAADTEKSRDQELAEEIADMKKRRASNFRAPSSK